MRGRRKSLIAASLTVWLAAEASAAELLPLGRELPKMPVLLCFTLESAKAQANLSRLYGWQTNPNQDAGKFQHKGCAYYSVSVVLIRRETTIPAFKSWWPAYSATGPEWVMHNIDGEEYRIGTRTVLSESHYFVVGYRSSNGQWSTAFGEIPDEPFILKYLHEKGKWP